MPRVPLHLHHGPLAGQPAAGRRSPLPHAELPLGQLLCAGGEAAGAELDLHELRDGDQRESEVGQDQEGEGAWGDRHLDTFHGNSTHLDSDLYRELPRVLNSYNYNAKATLMCNCA